MKTRKAKLSLVLTMSLVGMAATADEASFVRAYDAGKYDEAARQVEGLDTAKPGVARRLGVMYYNAKGVAGDQGRGRDLLEQAMAAGDATAAINLAKIYFKFEKNVPKAAWCLMTAETLGDVSIKDDVARIRKELGDDYQKGVVSYIGQLRDAWNSERKANKDKAAEFEQIRASLTKQLTDAQAASKKLREETDQTNKTLTEKLAASESKVKELETQLEDAKKKCADQVDLAAGLAEMKKTLFARDEEIAELKKSLAAEKNRCQEVSVKYNELMATSNQKVMQFQKDLAEAKQSATEAERKYKEMVAQYNKLVDKYNDLVRKYNTLLKTGKGNKTALLRGYDYNGNEIDIGYDGLDVAWGWLCRGLATFFSSPCNFVRTIPTVREVYKTSEAATSTPYAFFVAAISTPVVLCAETVPAVCDVGNGLLDVISLGAYGDWLYSGKLEPRWNRRDNSHFPWLDRK